MSSTVTTCMKGDTKYEQLRVPLVWEGENVPDTAPEWVAPSSV